jgi:hypothetical protein
MPALHWFAHGGFTGLSRLYHFLLTDPQTAPEIAVRAGRGTGVATNESGAADTMLGAKHGSTPSLPLLPEGKERRATPIRNRAYMRAFTVFK